MEYLNEENSPCETIVGNDHHKDKVWGMIQKSYISTNAQSSFRAHNLLINSDQ